MKVTLLLIGVLVCVFMAEASSVRRAENHYRAMLKRQYNPTFTWTTPPKPKAPVTTTKAPWTTARTVNDVTGCGDECDAYLLSSFLQCSQNVGTEVDTDAFVKCQESFFDSSCAGCLCDVLHTYTGASCDLTVTEDSGCGNTCDIESENAYQTCSQTVTPQDDPDAFMACWASLLDSDCHDCLCDFVHSKVGLTCPSY